MVTDEILQRLGEAVSRRRFIARTGTAFLGAAIAVMGFPESTAADGYHYYCCHLCYPPGSNPCSSPYCIWSWTCCYGDKRFRCSEWYCGAGGACNQGCIGVSGSTVSNVGWC